jgi:two-component system, OmpR family, sensor kinase
MGDRIAPPRTSKSKGHPQSLVAQFNRHLIAIGIGITAAFLLVVYLATANRFSYLEEREVASHFERAANFLASISVNMKARSLDWAVWDETWHYLADGNQAYVDANLNYVSIENLAINGLAFVDTNGRMVNSLYADLGQGRFDNRMSQLFGERAVQIALAARTANATTYQTFMVQDGRLLAISAARVMRSDGTGPPHGYIIFGQEVTAQDIGAGLDLPVTIDISRPASARSFTTDLSSISMLEPIIGPGNQAIAAFRFTAPRRLFAEGFRLIALAAVGAILLGTLLFFMFGRTVRRLVLSPLAAFQGHVASITETGDLRPYTDDPRKDELGLLYAEFNTMTEELTMLRAKVEMQSFIIGKRDYMASLVHNIGNGMGPVKTILTKLETQLAQPLSRDVKRALTELAAGEDPASRRARLVAFVEASMDAEQSMVADKRYLVRTALRSVDTVEAIVSNAMHDSQSDPVAEEPFDIGPVMTNAVALARMRDSKISVSLDQNEKYHVIGNSVLLAQVLENLLKNAVEAITSAVREQGCIDVAVKAADTDRQPAVSISITDNGDGFAPDHASHLFERGHSTREKNVGGLGLHWCANTINAMGGSLDLTSEGPGMGARAIIVLPVTQNLHDKGVKAD